MASSVRGTTNRVSKRQTGLRSYAKISKITKTQVICKSAVIEEAISPAVNPKQTTKSTPKRKRSEDHDDSETESGSAYVATHGSKKPKLQLLNPPSAHREELDSIDIEFSSPIQMRRLSLNTDPVPEEEGPVKELHPALQDFVSLHATFLRAYTVHIVYHGKSAPAELDSLMASITKLWKRRTVIKEDIQRMLAFYEPDVSGVASPPLLKHKEAPFRLTTVGGDFVRYNVEYVGGDSINRPPDPPYDEHTLQKLYESKIEAFSTSQRHNFSAWLHGELRYFPRLDFAVGVQTRARKEKVSAIRKEILANRPASPSDGLTNAEVIAEEIQTPLIVKDRTLSLLDRVRARTLAKSAATPHTHEAILRRYALGRIHEVVEILRMKQQRKLSSQFISYAHSSPSKVRGRVSFGLKQLVDDIKGSVAVPIGDAEVKTCIDILANDIPGIWCSVYTVGKLQSVVLNGPGLSGIEVKKILDEREKMNWES
ncbi:uncharacterized protein Z518_04770 [Rhinocladiella mackenziei CBS 650.93]|uniref:DNA replication factor Cdt1 C-terminal domain-containing protein n=1 Tax=Rhinocladiella mackenziei CBS 650.93 TaxID=1442369 RepID=A0A0D2IM04_9EURO|nr:uncharacterized protein Z518_04770 [Rhinocladiella mackenziei CBS 650.93]KIX06794.1 hypothetical protein Z518_04770 [Rhinocladiella mackenziei CBS 650.93]